jgi:hypothetical protein
MDGCAFGDQLWVGAQFTGRRTGSYRASKPEGSTRPARCAPQRCAFVPARGRRCTSLAPGKGMYGLWPCSPPPPPFGYRGSLVTGYEALFFVARSQAGTWAGRKRGRCAQAKERRLVVLEGIGHHGIDLHFAVRGEKTYPDCLRKM